MILWCHAGDVNPPDNSHPQLSCFHSQPHSSSQRGRPCCGKAVKSALDLNNAQLSLVQLSSELSSPKNGEIQVIFWLPNNIFAEQDRWPCA